LNTTAGWIYTLNVGRVLHQPSAFDGEKVKVIPPGCVAAANTSHFHRAKSGGYITQVTAIGPLGLEYLDLADDPRWSAPDG